MGLIISIYKRTTVVWQSRLRAYDFFNKTNLIVDGRLLDLIFAIPIICKVGTLPYETFCNKLTIEKRINLQNVRVLVYFPPMSI